MLGRRTSILSVDGSSSSGRSSIFTLPSRSAGHSRTTSTDGSPRPRASSPRTVSRNGKPASGSSTPMSGGTSSPRNISSSVSSTRGESKVGEEMLLLSSEF